MTSWWSWPPVLAVSAIALALTLLRGPPPQARLRRLTAARDGPGPPHRSVPTRFATRFASPLATLVARLVDRGRSGPEVRVLAELWAAELRSGQGVDQALSSALAAHPAGSRDYRRTSTAARLHGDVAAALRLDAERLSATDRAGLRALAACWVVGRDGGRGLADAVERVAASLRADETHRAAVRTELAGARTSARLLAVLPLLVLAMSTTLGLTSVAELLASGWAVASALVGAVLAAAGLWWTERIARAAEQVA